MRLEEQDAATDRRTLPVTGVTEMAKIDAEIAKLDAVVEVCAIRTLFSEHIIDEDVVIG
jgi:hypothetical protein